MKRAWIGLTAALALHVADEAFNDFLGFYNPFIMMLRDVLLLQWLPTFEFGSWLAGLIGAVAALALLTRFAERRFLAWLALLYALLMTLNGLAHIGMSIYTQRLIPGVLSAPVLLACALWLLKAAVSKLRA